MKTIKGNQLQEARLMLGLTQKELAEMAGVSTPTVQKAEHGDYITAKKLKDICNVLKINYLNFV